ncbi:MAG: leucine-rich repeat domain-containing protein [Candidatus Accumulibacter sp.]|nr:leucine-rich repeat domain-containing protein [Accumulibacter sp.]
MSTTSIDRARETMAEALRSGADTLDLHGLGLKELPPWPGGLDDLRGLDLSGNRLRSLPPEIWEQAGLEWLDLGSNRLASLDRGVGRLAHLRRLDLSENRLASLPAELATCLHLRHLDLFDNQFAEWPEVLLGLPELQRLDLAHNLLSQLPPLDGRLPALRELDLSSNRLSKVDALTALLAISRLRLDDNRITSIPEVLRALPMFSERGNPLAASRPELPPRPRLRDLVSGGFETDKRYFDAPLQRFEFALDLGGRPALERSLDIYYKGFAGAPVGLKLYDGTRLDLHRLSRKAAVALVAPAGGGFLQFEPTSEAGTVAANCEFAQRTLDEVPGVALLSAGDLAVGHAGVLVEERDGGESDAADELTTTRGGGAITGTRHFERPSDAPDDERKSRGDSRKGLRAEPPAPSLPVADRSSARAPGAPPPPPDAEAVDTAVFCPPAVARSSVFLVQAFLYPPDEIAAVEAEARQADEAARLRGRFSLPLDLPRGTRVDLHLEMPGLRIAEADAVLTWRGRQTVAQFEVGVPADVQGEKLVGSLRIAVAGMPKSTLRFQVALLEAGAAGPDAHACEIDARTYRRAFVSYSSKDRGEVLRRVQAFRIAGLSVFQDILDLEPGERWEKELYREIDNCDVFLLFWSQAAADSEWVGREIEYALARKHGDDDSPPAIQPVPIEGPPIPPPPKNLSALHFNDALLAQIAVAATAPKGSGIHP